MARKASWHTVIHANNMWMGTATFINRSCWTLRQNWIRIVWSSESDAVRAQRYTDARSASNDIGGMEEEAELRLSSDCGFRCIRPEAVKV
jgi:hypothetical protein